MRRIFSKRRPSPAMVVAIIALVAALGGTAAALPGKRTVKKDDIATKAVGKRAIGAGGAGKSEVGRNAVGKSELRTASVDSIETEDNSLTGDDIDESTIGNVQSATNATNAANAANVNANGVESGDIQNGAVTAPKVGTIDRVTASVTIPAVGTASRFVNCGATSRTLGGGASTSGGTTPAEAELIHLQTSRPFTTASGGWTARAYNGTATAKTLTVYALCLRP
jgi:hypothetical protein